MTGNVKPKRVRSMFRRVCCGLVAAGLLLQSVSLAEARWKVRIKKPKISGNIQRQVDRAKKKVDGAVKESVKGTERQIKSAASRATTGNLKAAKRDLKKAPRSGKDLARDPGKTLAEAGARTIQAVETEAERAFRELRSAWWFGRIQGELLRQFLERPKYILIGSDRPGSPLIYVNGMLTSESTAREDAEAISHRLHRPVKLFYNSTSGLAGDLEEAVKDREWPVTVLGRLGGMPANAPPILTGADRLQHNPTTRMLAWELYYTKEPVEVITHSQGNLCLRNALYTLTLLSASHKARNCAWVLAGPPLNSSEILTRAGKETVLNYKNDPVVKLGGMRGGGTRYNLGDHAAARFIAMLDNGMFF